jgi:hypothetical protein
VQQDGFVDREQAMTESWMVVVDPGQVGEKALVSIAPGLTELLN